MKMLIIVLMAALLALPGCVVMGPLSFSWRSNSTQQQATTDGKTDNAAKGNAVNADRTTEASTSVSTADQATVNRNQPEAK